MRVDGLFHFSIWSLRSIHQQIIMTKLYHIVSLYIAGWSISLTHEFFFLIFLLTESVNFIIFQRLTQEFVSLSIVT